jgi:hypothetical protein
MYVSGETGHADYPVLVAALPRARHPNRLGTGSERA